MLTAISLYTGVGGIDFGLEAAGYRTAVAIELDASACRTLRRNRNWPVIEGDIHQISSGSILDVAGLRPGEADILVGGPPCQPFSKSSYWVSGDSLRLDDPRAGTLDAYLRVLRDTRPRTFLLENVQGLVFKTKDDGLKHLLDGIREVNRQAGTNYKVEWKVLNSADFGVPQLRERVFLVGSREGVPFKFPAHTHVAPNQAVANGLPTYRTAWDAIGDLASSTFDPSLKMGGKWADLLPSIPEGQNYLWHTRRGGGAPLFGWRTRYWSFLLKLAKHQPSWTIQAQPGSAVGPFHWKNRRLSSAELCRIQTFPDGITFDCGRTEVQKMLGNAVPSLLIEVLAWEIRRQLLGDHRYPQKFTLMPPARLDCPRPEAPEKVPPKYKALLGDHADHPGEGRGAGALRRAAARDEARASNARGQSYVADKKQSAA